jgi:hypothetical protein
MTPDRKHPTAGFWITVALVAVLVGYPLSFGPACWWFSDSELNGGVVVNIVPHVYWPTGWLAENGPEPLSRAINWYGTLWIYWVHVPVNRAGDRWIVLVHQSD